MAPSVLRPLSAARVRPQGYDRRYDGCPARDAVRPAFAFHNSYRSFGDSVCGRDIGRVRADIVVIDATTPKQAIAEITRGLISAAGSRVPPRRTYRLGNVSNRPFS